MPQSSVITAPARLARFLFPVVCLLAPLAARADDGVFVRFQVPEPAGQEWKLKLGGFIHKEPWYLPESSAVVPAGGWSAWVDVKAWCGTKLHGRLNRSGGVAEIPNVTVNFAHTDAAIAAGKKRLLVQLATAADEKSVVKRLEESFTGAKTSFLVSPHLAKDADSLETASEGTQRRLGWAREATGGKRSSPTQLWLQTSFWIPQRDELNALEGEVLGLLGFNMVGGLPKSDGGPDRRRHSPSLQRRSGARWQGAVRCEPNGPRSSLLVLQQLHHRLTHRLTDIHVDLSLAAVVAIAAATLCHRVGVDGGDVAFELGILARSTVHGEMSVENIGRWPATAFHRFTQGAADELGFRGVCYGSSDVPLATECRLDPMIGKILSQGPLTHLYHSGLARCTALAETIAALTGVSAVTDVRLRERCFGTWELRRWDSIHAETGDAMMGMVTAPGTWRPPGGETTFELRDRVLAWYADLPATGGIVAVTHGGPIAALLGSLQQRPVAEWPQLIPPFGASYCIEVARVISHEEDCS